MYSPDGGHDLLYANKPLLAFDENRSFEEQKREITDKILECLGDKPEKVPLDPVIEYMEECEKYTEYRISFSVEEGVRAVCLFLIPKLGKEKYPLAVCLQGHTTGMHISLGREKWGENDLKHSDKIALKPLEKGFAVLCLEQRGMGERRTDREGDNHLKNGSPLCYITAMNSLLLGRTMIGERCHDVSCAIDLALTYPQIDGDKIVCLGDSGGGTATYYAACYDERIKVAMPNCSVCSFRDSIGAMYHCSCNFVPRLGKYMDMGDMAAAIAPRYLIVVNGKDDSIFPNHGVEKVYATIEKIYKSAGVPENCAKATGGGAHQYYENETWDTFDRIVKW